MEYSETWLIEELKSRKIEAYEALIRKYAKPVYYLAHNILSIGFSKEDIEECVSDVLLDVWLRIKQFDEKRGSFKTWILILTKYKALEYKRKNQKNNLVNIANYQPEERETVEKQVLGRAIQEKVLQTINKFSDTDRELFIRRYFFNEEICDLMESLKLTRSAIDNRLLRGRKIIKEVISYD